MRPWIAVVLIGLLTRSIAGIIQILYGIHGLTMPGLQVLDDYYAYYITQLHYLAGGYMLYRDIGYLYMPGFLYSLLPLYLLLGTHGPAIVMVITDALSAGLVYQIVKTQTTGTPSSGTISLAAGLVYALFPLAIVSEGYLWLSTEPMLCLMLLSVYLAQTKKVGWSLVVLAIAIGMKQEAVFILPGLLFMTRSDVKQALKGLVAGMGVLLGMALPFLVTAPTSFITSVTDGKIVFSSYPVSHLNSTGAWNIYNLTTSASAFSQCHQVDYWFYNGAVCGSVSLGQLLLNRIYLMTVPWFIAVYPLILLVSLGAAVFMGVRGMTAAYPQAIMGMLFLGILTFIVNQSWGYAVVPVYALLLTTVTTKRSMAVGGIIIGIEVFIPVYPIQLIILPIGFALMLFLDRRQSKNINTTTSISSHDSDHGL